MSHDLLTAGLTLHLPVHLHLQLQQLLLHHQALHRLVVH